MAFISGPMTNSNPGLALWTLIDAQMIAIGWTLDDTVTIGSNIHKVYKSAAAGNSFGKDWWMDIKYQATGVTNGISFMPMESYNNSTHLAFRATYAVNAASGIETTYYSRFGATGSALETNWTTAAVMTTVTTATTYAFSITRDFIIGCLGSYTGGVFAGFYTPTADYSSFVGADLFTLGTFSFSSLQTAANSQGASFTRVPRLTTVDNWNTIATGIFPTMTSTFNLGLANGIIGGAASPNTGKRTLINPTINVRPQTGMLAYEFIGYIPNIAAGLGISSILKGDTITIGSDTWYCFHYNNPVCFFFKAV